MTGRAQRLVLGALLALAAALAANGSALLPLWEPAGEPRAVVEAQGWAGGLRPQRQDHEHGFPAPLPRALLAAGLRLAGLQDTLFLARARAPESRRDASTCLHGRDEVFPFLGPARALHALRLLSVACHVLAAAAAWALARRLLPGRPGAALLAAALLACHPLALARAAGLGAASMAAAAMGLALVAAAGLARATDDAPRRSLLAGLLLGLAWLAGAPLLALLATAVATLAVRGRHAARGTLDRLVAGMALVAGPWLAWTLFGPDAAAPGPTEPRLAPATWLARALLALGGQPLPAVPFDGELATAWCALAAVAAGGALRTSWRPRAARPDARVAWVLVASCAAAAADGWWRSRDDRPFDTSALLAAGPALATLLAAGLAGLCAPRRAGALAGALLAAALALLAARHQAFRQGPAYWPPNRVHDAHLLCFDPLAGVPDERRLTSIPLLSPVDGLVLAAPPLLVWSPAADPDARYSVHLDLPGALPTAGTFEGTGLALRERFPVPESLWRVLPPGIDLALRVTRLPSVTEVFAGEQRPLLVDESVTLRVRRAPRPDEPGD